MKTVFLTSMHNEFKFLHKIRKCEIIKKIHIGLLYKGVVARIFDDEFKKELGTDKAVFFCEVFENKIYNAKKFPIFVGVYALKNESLSSRFFLSFKDLISIGNGELYESVESANNYMLKWRC